jgi:hypothetical protein
MQHESYTNAAGLHLILSLPHKAKGRRLIAVTLRNWKESENLDLCRPVASKAVKTRVYRSNASPGIGIFAILCALSVCYYEIGANGAVGNLNVVRPNVKVVNCI